MRPTPDIEKAPADRGAEGSVVTLTSGPRGFWLGRAWLRFLDSIFSQPPDGLGMESPNTVP